MNKSNKLMALLILTGSLATTSCNEQEEMTPSHIVENEGLDLEGNGTPQGTNSCTGNDNVTLNGTAQVTEAEILDYCVYGEIIYTLCSTGPTGPQLRFEGPFNSFIRPLTNWWAIGIIPLNQYNSSWSNILPTIQAEDNNPGILPNEQCTDFFASPQGVVGVNRSFFSPLVENYGLGYYNFDFPALRTNIEDAIVVWEGDADDPQSASEAFVIRVEGLILIPGPDNNMDGQPDFFTSQVIFDYRKAL